MSLASVSLDDKYRLEHGRVFLTGVQALTRLPMLQRQRDVAAGLNTSGYVSGYRGSPLGGLDTALQAAKSFLAAHQVSFHPAVNEDLAATAIWGTQQLHLFPDPRCDGVFAMWYGKGPGVDRSVDVLKNANYAGSARHGGVLLIAGDDPSARSSSVAHQSEHVFSACGIPVLAPASIQEYLDLGLHGWAMSRYSGCWVALKTTADTVESSASVMLDAGRIETRIPKDFLLPPDGLNLRWPDPQLVQERRMHEFKVYAAIAYERANRLNRLVFDAPRPRLGIIACGKAYLDVRQALDDLGIDEGTAAAIGLRLYKVAMPWPLEAEGVRHFAEGLEEILVVEEKRQIIEYQLKEQLYNWREDVRPRVVGKFADHDEWMPQAEARPASAGRAAREAASAGPGSGTVGAHGHWLLPPTGELTPAIVARAIAARIGRFHSSQAIRERLAFLEAKEAALARPRLTVLRTPWFCSGCPHNQSTKVPQGSCALAGVGCHLMAVWMGRDTATIAQMGGEGVTWVGAAEYSDTAHVFANMGDGTYYHSGLLAIRAAVAASVNITYKILYNDAVAMTGGQPVDGPITVPQITRQLAAEGVEHIVVLAEDRRQYGRDAGFAPGIRIRPREHLDAVQRELRGIPGVTALIYDQTCAAEKRRRRRRGDSPDPARRVFINDLVCEGCGDCSVKSNCLSVVPIETEFGRKRAIDQFSCNKDYSCIAGFCPSIVTVEGGALRRPGASAADAGLPELPEPTLPDLSQPWSIVIAGVGGTGVVTIGALIGMAAHIEGKGVSVLDMTGLSQKGGAVLSHVRLANRQSALHAVRVATGEANLLLGSDLIVAAGDDALSKTRAGITRAVVNTGLTITGAFVHDPDFQYPLDALAAQIGDAVGDGAADFVDASRLAAQLVGHSIATNMFLLGYAWQKGLVPVSADALMRAVEMNGVSVGDNRKAFLWGRRAACDRARVDQIAAAAAPEEPTHRLSRSLDELIERRRDYLVEYQNAAYARRYTDLVARVRAAEQGVASDSTALTHAVARAWFRLLARKDAYEVARLYTEAAFERGLRATFEGDYRLRFHFAVPRWGRVDPITGEWAKHDYGAWVTPLLRALARLRFLRDTPFDPFAHGAERRLERALIADYESTIGALLARLDAGTLERAVEIAALPETIRGFGPIRQRSAEAARKRAIELMAMTRGAEAIRPVAVEAA